MRISRTVGSAASIFIFIFTNALSTDFVLAQSIEDTTDKINKYAEALEGDASHYEAKYRGEAETLVRWRIGWEFLFNISDQAFAIRIAKELIAKAAVRVQVLQDYSVRRSIGEVAPEVAFIHEAALRDLDTAESILSSVQQRPLVNCDNRGIVRIAADVPTDSVLLRHSPNVAIYPVVRSDPILRFSFAIGDDGTVSIAPAPYQDEAQGKGKMAVPAIASTVSYAIVLQAMGRGAWLPATGIATFVYLLADHGQKQYEEGKLADAVMRMNSAIDRIVVAQDAGFLYVDKLKPAIGMDLCTESFSPSLERMERLAMAAAAELLKVRGELATATKKIKPKSDADDWTIVECEIFRCSESVSYFTWTLDELTSEIQSRNSTAGQP